MKLNRSAAVLMTLALTLAPAFARKKKIPPAPSRRQQVQQMSPDEEILHALNRLGFGPRPGDVERIRAIGLNKWIEAQLHPESIPENPELAARLAPLDTLAMTPVEMARKYPSNLLLKQMIAGKLPWPTDPDTRVIVQRIAARYEEKTAGAANGAEPTFESSLAKLPPEQKSVMESGGPVQQLAVFDALPISDQFDLIATMPQKQRQKFYAIASPVDRRRILSFGGAQKVVIQDLPDAKIFRAVYSNRQLEEVLDGLLVQPLQRLSG